MIKVAIAAPFTPKAGIRKTPKMKEYLMRGLRRVMKSLITKGILVAPAAENPEMLTCLISKSGILKSVIER